MQTPLEVDGVTEERGLAIDRDRMASDHSHARVLEVAQQCVDRPVLDNYVGAHHQQDLRARRAQEDVDGRCLAFTPRLFDQANALVATGYVADDRDGRIVTAAGDHDELGDAARRELLAEHRPDGVGDVGFLVVSHDPDAARSVCWGLSAVL